jgi:hypothetical protein
MNPDKLKKWNKWLGNINTDGSITYELGNLSVIREVNTGLKEMVQHNKGLQIHSAFYSVTNLTYSHSVLMYIRRQVRKDKGCISLILLAEDLLKNHETITKEFYSNLYIVNRDKSEHESYKDLGEKDFENNFGGKCVYHLDPNVIRKDIDELEKISKDSSDFIDRRLAHTDKREPVTIPYMSEIEVWSDTLNSILKKYIHLLRAVDYKIEPVLQHDWKSIFRKPWL